MSTKEQAIKNARYLIRRTGKKQSIYRVSGHWMITGQAEKVTQLSYERAIKEYQEVLLMPKFVILPNGQAEIWHTLPVNGGGKPVITPIFEREISDSEADINGCLLRFKDELAAVKSDVVP